MENIFISGISGSGKGLLRTLLDGHGSIVNCPFQGYGYNFIDDNFDRFIRRSRPYATLSRLDQFNKTVITIENNKVTIGELFRSFARSYGEIVDASISKKIRAASSAEGEVFVDFELDVHEFNRIIYGCFNNKDYSIGEVFSVFSNALVSSWSNISIDKEDIKYFSQSSHNGIDVVRNIMKRMPESKIIIVDRDPIDLVYTNAKKAVLKRYGLHGFQKILEARDSFIFVNTFSRYLLSSGYIKKVNEFKSFVSSVEEDKRVHVVDFEKLVHETVQAMSEIAIFLGINYEDCMARATLNSVDIESDDNNFIGQINDRSDDYVSGIKKVLLNLVLDV